MKGKIFGIVALFAMFVFVAHPGYAQSDKFSIGESLDDFTMAGTDGKQHSFNSLRGKNGTVLIFLSAQCPVVKAYIARIGEIAEEYKDRGINFVGINSNNRNAESLEWVTSDAAENFKFPMLIDEGNVMADKLGATVTPEVYYFDAENKLLYHGAIDNDRSGRNIEHRYLKTAFDTALGGGKIETTRTNAFGCEIKRVAGK
jgi:alkyl hydroperoxide reductase subunit AhpC